MPLRISWFEDYPQEAIVPALFLMAISVSFHFLARFLQKRARRQQLNQWIAKARDERESKQFSTLQVPLNMKHADDFLSLSAKELADRFRCGQLDPSEAVVFYAQRCQKYGRDKSGINTIMEELYDDAFQ